MLRYAKHLKEYSRQLRKNMTDAEKALWFKIRDRQLKGYLFNRQKPIGKFIVDFYSSKAKIVIEVDGGQHYSNSVKKEDASRDEFMKSFGLKVLRFSDREIFENLDGVLEKIWINL
jgi:very-short-patch-repair endonuclease